MSTGGHPAKAHLAAVHRWFREGERMKTLGAARFWTEFRTAFQSSSGNPTTEVGIHYRKFRDRGSEESDTEWTHLMGAFLSRLAITLGFYQEWEPLDFVWYEEDRMKPSV